MNDCQLIEHDGKWYCPACDPRKRRPLKGNFRRNCRVSINRTPDEISHIYHDVCLPCEHIDPQDGCIRSGCKKHKDSDYALIERITHRRQCPENKWPEPIQ